MRAAQSRPRTMWRDYISELAWCKAKRTIRDGEYRGVLVIFQGYCPALRASREEKRVWQLSEVQWLRFAKINLLLISAANSLTHCEPKALAVDARLWRTQLNEQPIKSHSGVISKIWSDNSYSRHDWSRGKVDYGRVQFNTCFHVNQFFKSCATWRTRATLDHAAENQLYQVFKLELTYMLRKTI